MALGSAAKKLSGAYTNGTANVFDRDRPADHPVEGVRNDPSQALRRSLTPRLSEAEEEKLASKCLVNYRAALQDRLEWENRLEEWENAYYNKVVDKDFPWPGAANFHVPITMMGVETYKPRLVEGVLGQVPPVLVIPTRGSDEDRRDVVESFLNWQILTQLKLEETVQQSAHLFLQPGLAIAKTYWKVERQWRKFIREFDLNTPLDTIFEAIFGLDKPRNLERDGEDGWYAQIPSGSSQAGGPLDVYLRIKPLPDEQPPVLQVMVEREDVTEFPWPELIEPVDFIAPAKGGQDPNKLPWCQHRLWMDEGQIRMLAKLGRFYPDAVEDLFSSGPPRGDQPVTDSQQYRDSVDRTEGIEGQGPSNVRRNQWAILEDYRRYDIDDDGVDEEIIVWVSPYLSKRILGWDYLDNVYGHGRRPFRVGRYHPIPFRFYGLSFAEQVRNLQEEINTIRNQRVDYGTLQNLPFGFKRASSSLPPINQRMAPGMMIDVDNPQTDVFFPKIQGSPAWGMQEEATLMQHFERLTGLTDLAIGKQPNRVGATRTASGTQTLLSESGLRFKGALNNFQRFWTGIFDDILALDQEYLPPRTEFRVTGRLPTTIQIKDRMELRGRFDLHLASGTETLNRQRMREGSMQILQMLMNPALLQAGIVGIKGVRRGVADVLKSYGMEPFVYLEEAKPPLGPVEELMLFMQGQYVDPVMGENIEIHLAHHMAALQSGLLKPEAAQMIQRHIQATQQLQQQMQMQQVMQQQGPQGRPQLGTQGTNAQTGAAAPQGPPQGPQPPGANMGM